MSPTKVICCLRIQCCCFIRQLWHSGLESLALNWTEKCQWQHNWKRHRIPGFDYRYVGENMYLTLTWFYTTRALDQWHNEKKFLTAQLSCRSSRQCGHYVQMVWYNTETVGCAVRYCNRMKYSRFTWDGFFFMVCDYGPLGNTRGIPLFNKGEPCSQCPPGRVCVDKLCALPNCNNISCQNGGQLIQDVCMCNCTNTGYEGETCQTRLFGEKEGPSGHPDNGESAGLNIGGDYLNWGMPDSGGSSFVHSLMKTSVCMSSVVVTFFLLG